MSERQRANADGASASESGGARASESGGDGVRGRSPRGAMRAGARPWLGALAIDVAAVLMFATAGRQSHDEGSGIGTILTIAAPFLVALAVGWVITPHARRVPLGLLTALGIWASTVVVGLVLRRTLWDRGTALSFVIVTTLVLGALLFGWRALWSLTSRRQTLHSSPPPSRADR